MNNVLTWVDCQVGENSVGNLSGGGSSPVPVRQNSTAYAAGDRVLYPDKAGFVIVCTTAGTSAASAPSWPASITSGTTTLTDGTAVWTIYDATAPDMSAVGGLSTALSTKAGNSDVALLSRSTAYAVGDRVIYPEKTGYIMVCTTAGTSNSSAPAFPASVTSGTTTLTDGTVTWTIYDVTAPEIATVNGLSSAINGKADVRDVALRVGLAEYSAGDTVLYPGKYGYILKCSTAGTTGFSLPAWPASIVSGTTTITDGTVVWKVYDTTAMSSMPIGTIFIYPLSTPPAGAFK